MVKVHVRTCLLLWCLWLIKVLKRVDGYILLCNCSIENSPQKDALVAGPSGGSPRLQNAGDIIYFYQGINYFPLRVTYSHSLAARSSKHFKVPQEAWESLVSEITKQILFLRKVVKGRASERG